MRTGEVALTLASCTLRGWRHEDAASLTRHANNPNVARNLADVFPYPYTMDDARIWIGRHAGVEPPRVFAIVIDGDAVGGVGLEIGTDIHRRSAELGYWLAEPYWGRGIVTDAVRAVIRYGFATFDLEHIFAGLFERNVGSRRVLEKAGFTLEGRLRMHVTKNGETMNDLIFGITRADIEKQPPQGAPGAP